MYICMFSTIEFADSEKNILPNHYFITVDTHSDQVGTKALRQASKLIHHSIKIRGII